VDDRWFFLSGVSPANISGRVYQHNQQFISRAIGVNSAGHFTG
jgi:hypothetical protein